MFDTASIAAALSSAKIIVELAKNANDAQLAMKISDQVAELQGRLIDVQQQALELQAENQRLRDEIHSLKRQLSETAEAETCPKCLHKSWRVESSRLHTQFGNIGVSERVYKCGLCGFVETKLIH